MAGYLYTPVMYIFLSVYLGMSGVFFVIGNLAARSANVLTLLSNMSYLWMLLTPVLTMRLLNAAGGDQWLYGAPLSLGAIVAGKYLAALTVLLAAIALSLLYPALISLYGTLYVKEALAGYLGFFLLGASFLALDMLISALSRTPIVALVASFGVNLFVWLYDLLMKAVSIPGLSAVAGDISLYSHLQPFLSGRIGLSDVVFSLSLIPLLLFLCVRALEARRWKDGL